MGRGRLRRGDRLDLYFINRYRKGDVQIGDITTVIGAIGGGAVTTLFDPVKGDLFAAYGLGLAIGFFTYFLVLVVLVGHSRSFTSDWFLDGRRPNPPDGWGYPPDAQQSVRPFDASPGGAALPGGSRTRIFISRQPRRKTHSYPRRRRPRRSAAWEAKRQKLRSSEADEFILVRNWLRSAGADTYGESAGGGAALPEIANEDLAA